MTSISVDHALLAQQLNGKTAIVTGGANGIGRATVQLLHSHGANVVISDLSDADGEALATSLGCGRAKYIRANVAVWADMLSLFRVTREAFGTGRVDIVVANAGLMERSDFLDERVDGNGDLAEPDYSVVDVNLKGCLNTTKLSLFNFKQQSPPGGSLILVSSISGYVGGRDVLQYKASKHGVIGVLRGASRHAVDSNSRVTAIAPYMTQTHMTSGFSDEWTSTGIPSNEPSDVAAACAVAAVDETLNGCTLWVAGGRISEVEKGYQSSIPQWLGPDNWRLLRRGAELLSKGYRLPTSPRDVNGVQ